MQQIVDYAAGDDFEWADEVYSWIHKADLGPFLARDVNAGLSGGEIKRSELMRLATLNLELAPGDKEGQPRNEMNVMDWEALSLSTNPFSRN